CARSITGDWYFDVW
nr:immunoglobulin heavy chain junction region [Mus musculus]